MTGGLKDAPSMLAGAVPTVGELFRSSAQVHSSAIAIEYQGRQISYGQLLERVERASAMLASHGLRRGDRVALLSHNRPEYFEIELAAANLGVITACLNWRLSPRELAYCVELVSPKLVIVEQALAGSLPALALEQYQTIEIGPHYERLLQQHSARAAPIAADCEDGLVILYTSGTTGLPKGAVISHRAMMTRALVFTSELNISHRDSFVAWAPMFHMASTDHGLATLLRGGTVVMIDGFQVEPLLDGRRTPPDRLAGADSRHGGGVCRGAEGAVNDGPGYRRLRRDGRSGTAACDRRSDRTAAGALSQQLRFDRNRPAAGDASPDRAWAKFRRGCPSSRARSARSGWSMPPIRTSRRASPASLPFAARRCSPAIGRPRKPTRTISAAAGSTWATCSGAMKTERSISSIASNT